MNHKVSELTGALLDAAVAKADGFVSFWIDPGGEGRDAACVLGPVRADDARFDWAPSTAWEQGGPIIDREKLMLSPPTSPVHRNGGPLSGWGTSGVWSACTWHKGTNGRRSFGYHETSPLIAAMRCYVHSKFGDEVELPCPTT